MFFARGLVRNVRYIALLADPWEKDLCGINAYGYLGIRHIIDWSWRMKVLISLKYQIVDLLCFQDLDVLLRVAQICKKKLPGSLRF